MSVSESIATCTSSAISASFMLAPIGNGHARGIRVVEGGFMGARVGARGVRRSLSPLQRGLRASEGSCGGPDEEEWGPGDSFASEWPKTAAGYPSPIARLAGLVPDDVGYSPR